MNSPKTSRTSQIVIAILAVLSVFIIFYIIADQYIIGVDYYYTYCPVAHDWLDGKTQLYYGGHGFFNAPWTLGILVPLCLPPYSVGMAIWNTLTLWTIVASIAIWQVDQLSVPRFAIFISIINVHTFDLLLRGQVDGFVLLAIPLGWWAIYRKKPIWLGVAFSIMALKPLNLLLLGVLFLLQIRAWGWREKLHAIVVPTGVFSMSGLIFGLDWPLRYLEQIEQTGGPADHLAITLWHAADDLGLPDEPLIVLGVVAVMLFLNTAWRVGARQWMISVAIATNLVFTTYASGNHYVLLIPALLFVARHSQRTAIAIYLLSWTPFVRLIWLDKSWIDIGYAIGLLIASWYWGLMVEREKMQEDLVLKDDLDGSTKPPGGRAAIAQRES